jgi:dTDP-4-amino-4,6-dideoxygalactose transaminase
MLPNAVLTSCHRCPLVLSKAFAVKADDEVLVPSHTAFPTVEAVCFAGAVPVFVDVDDSYTVDLEDAALKVSARTVGFVPVHLYGHPADLDGVRWLCAERSLWLLEDCAQAHGAAWRGRKVGTFGRAGVFSFYPSKNLTVMGDGGLVVTDDADVAGRCRRLRDHGRLSKDVHAEIGFNLRFNDIQAAIGRVLLRRLDAMNDHRRSSPRATERGLASALAARREAAGAHRQSSDVIRTPERDASKPQGARHRHRRHYPAASHRSPPGSSPACPPGRADRKEILTLPISASHRGRGRTRWSAVRVLQRRLRPR